MVTDTFFDLQRFAVDTLIGSESGIEWAGGASFMGEGTKVDPAYLVAAGTSGAVSIIKNTKVYLTGTEQGYSFAINQTKDDWEVSYIPSTATVSGDFSKEDGAYELYGNVAVKVFGDSKEGFTEDVNGEETYVKSTDDAEFMLFADHQDAFDFLAATEYIPQMERQTPKQQGELAYLFQDGASNLAVGVDGNDMAYFAGNAKNVSLGAQAKDEAIDPNAYDFEKMVAVSTDGTSSIYMFTNDNVITRNNVTMTVDAAGQDFATIQSNSIDGVSSVIVEGVESIKDYSVNGTAFEEISGSMNGVKFEDVNGEIMAHVDNTGAVTVEAGEGQKVGFAKITEAGTVVNGATVKGLFDGDSFAVELAGQSAGFTSIAFDDADPVVNVAGVKSFKVFNAGASYSVETSADDISFDGNAKEILVDVKDGAEYTIDGVDGAYAFEDDIKKGKTGEVVINGASVAITNGNSANDYIITSTDETEGVDVIYAVAGDKVDVSNDPDSYSVVFSSNFSGEDVVLNANGYQISVDDYDIDGNVTMAVGVEDEDGVLVKGLKSTGVVLNSDGVYHFTDDSEGNEVTRYGEDLYVTLDSKGNVADILDAETVAKLAEDESKWALIGLAGSEYDTVKNNHGKVYETFYDLEGSGLSSTLAAYDYDDDTKAATDEASAINITADKSIAQAGHVTLEVGSGTYVGQVPINIQQDESDSVVDVELDLVESNNPATVVVGVVGGVSAAHKVYLSDSGTAAKPNYAYIGEGATNNNLVQAGAGAAMIRHDGDVKSSIYGGAGNDSILAGKNDSVKGGAGADLFYDSASYTVQDYSFGQGDAVIATRLNSLDYLTPDQISGTGNKVAIAGGQELTFANVDKKAALSVKVAVMDNDANVLKDRANVVLANGNGEVNATAAGNDGAMILAGSSRGDGVHTVIGSAGKDFIVAGSNDSVDGGASDDFISLDSGASGATVVGGNGADTVMNWQFGFDQSKGHTKLDLDGEAFSATIVEDQIVVSLSGGNSVTFADTKGAAGAFEMLIDDKKYTAMRTDGAAYVKSNENLADIYWAQADGTVVFGSNVTKDLGMLEFDSEKLQNIDSLVLLNNSKASVMGSDANETVVLSGAASVGANKAVSLGAGNDFIISGGDSDASASNVLYFGAGDGRDSLHGFNHYHGFDEDPQKQHSDLLVVDNFLGVDVATSEGVDRIIFKTNEQDEIAIYEENPLDVDNNMYRVKINGFDETVAKIGYSDGTKANTFTYSDEVKYYVGNATKAIDTLKVGDDVVNAEIWLDSTRNNEFYRGIGAIDASAATGTNLSLAGSMDNNTIIGGGEGSNSMLWGGAGDNVLIGGDGADTFLYYQNSRSFVDGAADMENANHDVINNYDYDKDNIFLADVTLDDIADADIQSNAIKFTFFNGGTLTINGDQEHTRVILSDGRTGEHGDVYVAERSTDSWNKQ